ncbi:phage tail assembly chaperone [Pseudomonas sp. 008]|uniref:phage tail assembly chaperone n=1 Tax=Pseudomonas sp. 008 TaxID=2803906 RepID=UPI001952836D|nr:phage tail assembly chaperone [Pseudomonas sp. 008]GID08017.1 hypothetical protein TMM008_52190 [Pseudomonas sp. 008]
MAVYARLDEGVVAELIDTGHYAITELFAPGFLTSMSLIPEGVEVEVGERLNPIEPSVAPPVASDAHFDSSLTADMSEDDPVMRERLWRRSSLSANQWLVARHRDEQDLGRVTTLTAKQYLELLEYRQALREWPESSQFPQTPARPAAPHWLTDSLESH